MTYFRSLSFRLAAIYASVFVLSIGLILGLFYWANVHRPMVDVQAAITLEAEDLAQIYMIDGEAALIEALARGARRSGPNRLFAVWQPAQGSMRRYNVPTMPRNLGTGWHEVEADVYREGVEFDRIALLNGRRFDDGNRLFVGRDIEDIDETIELIEAAATWMIPATLTLGLVGGLLTSRTIGRRIDRISAAARQVMAGDLSGRVPSTGGKDDFEQLAATLNAMLDRLQSAFDTVRRVSDHAAHQLKTPLARLTVDLEELRTAPTDERDGRLDGCAAEARRLQEIIDALLRISRLDNTERPAMAPVALDRLIEDLVDYYTPEAEARAQMLTLARNDQVLADGDADLLAQAVSNLIDNAIKFTPHGGTVSVGCTVEGERAIVSVADSGPGLDPGEADRVADLFFRGGAAAGVEGNGLGLSLVASVAKVHGARLRLENGNPGLVATLEFMRAN